MLRIRIVKAQVTCSIKCQHYEVFFGKQSNLTIVDDRLAWDIVGNEDNSSGLGPSGLARRRRRENRTCQCGYNNITFLLVLFELEHFLTYCLF